MENKGKAGLRTKHFIYLCLVDICVYIYSYIDICTCAYILLYLTAFTSRHHGSQGQKIFFVHPQAVGVLFRGKSLMTPSLCSCKCSGAFSQRCAWVMQFVW